MNMMKSLNRLRDAALSRRLVAKLLTPAFDRLTPNHHVMSDLLALPLRPLFRGPRSGDRDRQQEY
jgi:hypothetical protein